MLGVIIFIDLVELFVISVFDFFIDLADRKFYTNYFSTFFSSGSGLDFYFYLDLDLDFVPDFDADFEFYICIGVLSINFYKGESCLREFLFIFSYYFYTFLIIVVLGWYNFVNGF